MREQATKTDDEVVLNSAVREATTSPKHAERIFESFKRQHIVLAISVTL